VRDLAFDIEVVVLPTIREQTGLALSSRNAYLSDEQHKAAAVLYRALAQGREVYLEGERNARRLGEVVRAQVESEPLARIEYVGVVDAETMEKFERIPEDRPVLIALAAQVGPTRLIDNIVLQPARQKAHATGRLTLSSRFTVHGSRLSDACGGGALLYNLRPWPEAGRAIPDAARRFSLFEGAQVHSRFFRHQIYPPAVKILKQNAYVARHRRLVRRPGAGSPSALAG
jgi:hypothetical protein